MSIGGPQEQHNRKSCREEGSPWLLNHSRGGCHGRCAKVEPSHWRGGVERRLRSSREDWDVGTGEGGAFDRRTGVERRLEFNRGNCSEIRLRTDRPALPHENKRRQRRPKTTTTTTTKTTQLRYYLLSTSAYCTVATATTRINE